jgi:hypothetical protein
LIFLILVDAAFILSHRLLFMRGRFGERFSLESETGLPEYYQNLKELAAALIVFALLFKSADLLYLCWTLLFTYLFIDDSFEIHETYGLRLSRHFTPAYGLRTQDYGELVVSVTAGLVFVALLVIGYRRGKPRVRQESKVLLGMVLALAVFGVLFDMAHVKVLSHPWNHRLGMIEDGGEMLVMSIILWYVFTNLQEYVVGLPRQGE